MTRARAPDGLPMPADDAERRGHDVDAGDARLAQAGDREAFARLVERHARRVHDLARRMLRDAHEAEDVAQQAFANAWRALERFDTARPWRHWLLRITSNLCRNRLARRKRSPLLRPAGGETPAPDPPATDRPPEPGPEADRRRVRAALERLPERYRLPMILHYVHRESLADIGRIAGLPVATVKTHLFRGREALRRALLADETRASAEGTEGRDP